MNWYLREARLLDFAEVALFGEDGFVLPGGVVVWRVERRAVDEVGEALVDEGGEETAADDVVHLLVLEVLEELVEEEDGEVDAEGAFLREGEAAEERGEDREGEHGVDQDLLEVGVADAGHVVQVEQHVDVVFDQVAQTLHVGLGSAEQRLHRFDEFLVDAEPVVAREADEEDEVLDVRESRDEVLADAALVLDDAEEDVAHGGLDHVLFVVVEAERLGEQGELGEVLLSGGYLVQEEVYGESSDAQCAGLHEVDEVVHDFVVGEVILAADELVECFVREDEV